MTPSSQASGDWGARAKTFLDEALADVASGEDAIPNVTAALACLRIEAGELPPDDSLLDDEPAECICPPGLVARGGFKSGCPVHA